MSLARVHLSLLVGRGVPFPAPRLLMNALESPSTPSPDRMRPPADSQLERTTSRAGSSRAAIRAAVSARRGGSVADTGGAASPSR